jgi:hypothetical protein
VRWRLGSNPACGEQDSRDWSGQWAVVSEEGKKITLRRRKSGVEPPHSIGEDGCKLSKDMIAYKLIRVIDNYIVILMGVAI